MAWGGTEEQGQDEQVEFGRERVIGKGVGEEEEGRRRRRRRYKATLKPIEGRVIKYGEGGDGACEGGDGACALEPAVCHHVH